MLVVNGQTTLRSRAFSSPLREAERVGRPEAETEVVQDRLREREEVWEPVAELLPVGDGERDPVGEWEEVVVGVGVKDGDWGPAWPHPPPPGMAAMAGTPPGAQEECLRNLLVVCTITYEQIFVRRSGTVRLRRLNHRPKYISQACWPAS